MKCSKHLNVKVRWSKSNILHAMISCYSWLNDVATSRIKRGKRLFSSGPADQKRRPGRNPSRAAEERLPIGWSVVAIAGLSALCWALVIAIFLGLRAAS
jgi:hypothetical protein